MSTLHGELLNFGPLKWMGPARHAAKSMFATAVSYLGTDDYNPHEKVRFYRLFDFDEEHRANLHNQARGSDEAQVRALGHTISIRPVVEAWPDEIKAGVAAFLLLDGDESNERRIAHIFTSAKGEGSKPDSATIRDEEGTEFKDFAWVGAFYNQITTNLFAGGLQVR